MTDQRPQYGELATPEEQRRAAGLPPLDEVQPLPEQATPAQSVAPAAAVPEAPVSSGSRPVDRLVTIALLAYGLVNVVITGLSYLDFSTVMDQAMNTLGIEGEFTNFAQGRTWGTIAAVVLVIGWSLTAMLAIRRLRRGRRSWWVPLVGAAATLLLTSICVAVPMLGDPAFLDYVSKASGS
ncbi:DUF6264 family protein [Microbacterium sp. SD291]|uniref:DUF6264 family protein n=1 Tax=Microbacterium sp. SD291 TaxID=2782007 RepID=UPI001A96D535|nr:DUF6264 family protein [Microbacterium sp. SD291]MBO0979264.1 hypothetical protein [Microbacterium sp. SD291]